MCGQDPRGLLGYSPDEVGNLRNKPSLALVFLGQYQTGKICAPGVVNSLKQRAVTRFEEFHIQRQGEHGDILAHDLLRLGNNALDAP